MQNFKFLLNKLFRKNSILFKYRLLRIFLDNTKVSKDALY